MTTLIVSKEFKYPSGNVYHVRCEALRSTEMNADMYRVLYSVNGSYFHANGEPRLHEYFAQRHMYAHHRFAANLDEAVTITLYAVENTLDTREYRQQNTGTETPLACVNRIMDWIRTNRNLVCSAFAMTALMDTPTVKIEVWKDNEAAVSNAIAAYKNGVDIVWVVRERPAQTDFRGIMDDDTQRIPTLDTAA